MTGVRTAVVVAGLGGGTGGGAAIEIVDHLRSNGVATLLFATLPFKFEGEECRKRAMSVRSLLESGADVSVTLPLDALVAGGDASEPMSQSLRRATDTLSAGVTLLWRLVEKPGYIRLDEERLRKILLDGGPARMVTATASGPDRAEQAVEAIRSSPLLTESPLPRMRAMLVGVLAGDDLRLAEVGQVSGELTFAYGSDAALSLGTVNDEATFSGRLTVVALLFGEGHHANRDASARRERGITGPRDKGRFDNAVPSKWRGEDLDSPAYLRRGLTLER